MATIALYAGKINQMPEFVNSIRKSVTDYKSELSAMRTKSLQINQSICDLSSVITSIQAASQTQVEKEESLDLLNQGLEQFTAEAVRIDNEVADMVRQRKDDFYEQYNYLKPASEMNGWEKFCDGCAKAGEWCREHWKEIVITISIVIGAVLAIVAVVCTGGMALVPMLSAMLTAFGVSAGLATTIATVASLTIAGIGVFSTLVSSTLNIIGTWGDYSDNSTFKAWQNAMNWMSMISNGFYSIGSMYNSYKGITNADLRIYSDRWLGNSEFRNAILNADKYNFFPEPNKSTFWAGLGKTGQDQAKNYAVLNNRSTLEMTMESHGIPLPGNDDLAWHRASSSYAMRSSGVVEALLGKELGNYYRGKLIGANWLNFESILLNINPNVTMIMNTQRVFQFKTFFTGLSSAGESIINALYSLLEIIERGIGHEDD